MREQEIPMCKSCADANDPVKLRATIAALRASHAELAEAVKRLMVCMALAGWESDPAAEFAPLCPRSRKGAVRHEYQTAEFSLFDPALRPFDYRISTVAENASHGQAAMSDEPLVFADLWVGDRFNAYGHLWTKLGHDTARQHCADAIALGERGYGYIGDTICSFEPENAVEFVPPASRATPT